MRATTTTTLQALRSAALLLAALTFTSAGSARAACDCTVLPTLGAAAEFPALGLGLTGGTAVELIGSVFAESTYVGPATDGNIGGGPGGSVLLQGAAAINGHIHHHPFTPVTGGAQAFGGVAPRDMLPVIADAVAASAAYEALTPTQTFASLTTSATITGNGCINVVQVRGEIDLENREELTFRGTSDDYFVVNVYGPIEVTGNAEIILDGLNPHQVIFNILDPGEDVHLQGDGTADGTFLNIGGDIDIQGNAGGRGAYMAGGSLLRFQGNADFYGEAFECGRVPACPDPERSGVNIQTPSTPTGRSTGNTPFFYAYYDTSNFEGHLEAFRVSPNGTVKDLLDVAAIDPVTDLPLSTRTPFWDAGVLLRNDTSRNIYTTKAGARVDFNTTNVSTTDLNITLGEVPSYPNFPASGVDDLSKLHAAIVAHMHGKDSFDEDLDMVRSEMRGAVMGDIFRSNALFVGSPMTLLSHEPGYSDFLAAHGQRDRVVYAGANDALLHGFDAGPYYNPSDPNAFDGGTGNELFAYTPGLLLDTIKLTPKYIDANGDRLVPGFVDGNNIAADAWLGDGSGTDTTKSADEWATVLMTAYREGGRGFLTLDVTEPGATSGAHAPYPKLLWEFTDPRMGQSWSKAVITRVKVKGATASGDNCGENDGDVDCREQWVAIFGAGLELDTDPNDIGYISDPTNIAWTNRSKAIFMLALDSGQVLARVAFDATGTTGPATMRYAIPSAPAVLDTDNDGFADVVYVGDTAGQVWKWNIHNVGYDSADADTLFDNYSAGVFFRTNPVVLGTGQLHYRSLYAPPTASFVNGQLTLTFGTGERRDVLYAGDVLKDDNNRLYVVRDDSPQTQSTTITEADLVEATSSALYIPAVGKKGYFIKAPDGEKFFTDILVFAGYVIALAYEAPAAYPTCGDGFSNAYVFRIDNARGFFDANGTAEAGDRKMQIGAGIPSSPRVTIASDPTDDKVFITTSTGQVLVVDPPQRDPPTSETLYWKQNF
jgi:hypothetical protein